jgi:hypothetical protein
METIHASEPSVYFKQTTRRHILIDSIFINVDILYKVIVW